ncbi:uncharacterized protein MELLADRAFT_62948 [Melampsora larici-populina 98AG31]|uniref:CCHC-type domain-containing protein n=1 Tax=Melampsora larici-populina (strain 98AG31 / pathotype 3-4-7) TaxID=747676 RepID=F4RKR0_MELLP|nr:uncharacterized protein MELLADRAFT_62948 [Melampsora larici-populina 98AG31]EGG06771.1 hypothetical protein MELLADRAFT_62948 [Melampsora larici-populina 98AG31]
MSTNPASKAPPEPPPHSTKGTVDDYRSNKFQLSMPAYVKGSVDTLKADGSNYTKWEFKIGRCVDRVTKTTDYLSKDGMKTIDPDGDAVIYSMIELVVPFEIQHRLSGSAKDAIRTIRSLFFFPSRSGHMATWKEVLEVKYDDVSDIGDYFRKIDQKVSDLERAGFEWNKDVVTGVLYQLGLGNAFTNVNNTLNARLRATPTNPISAREVEEAIRAEKQIHQTDNIAPAFSQLDLNAFNSNPLRRGAVNTGNTYRPAALTTPGRGRGVFNYAPQPPYRVSTPTRTLQLTPKVVPPTPGVPSKFHPSLYNQHSPCFICHNVGHWSDTCPTRYPCAATTTPSVASSQPHQSTSRSTPTQPRSFTLNLIDANGTAFAVEATGVEDDEGPLPEGVWASEGTLTEVWDAQDEGVSDTGATHMVTGKLSHLTDIRALSRPIPISVATKAPKAYVTHVGTMHIKIRSYQFLK